MCGEEVPPTAHQPPANETRPATTGPARARPLAREDLMYRLYSYLYSCITPLHQPRVGTHSLQRLYSSTALYSPLQPSTALYSSTALHPLQYTTLYSTPLGGG